MRRNDCSTAKECPAAKFQRMISGKYKLRILWGLKDGPMRYNEIRRGLLTGTIGTAEIAPRVLSRELKVLTEVGLLNRTDFGTHPPKVEYVLTKAGKSFMPVIASMQKWAMKNF